MKVFKVLSIMMLCYLFVVAFDGDKKKAQYEEERIKEELLHKKMLKEYYEYKADSVRVEVQCAKENNSKTENSQNDTTVQNNSERVMDKKEGETQELKEKE